MSPKLGKRGNQVKRPDLKRHSKKNKFKKPKSSFKNFKSGKSNVPSISNVSTKTNLKSNFVEVSIANQKSKALVDTGSSLSCIHQSLLSKIDSDFQNLKPSQHTHVMGVSGHLLRVKGTVTLNLKIGENNFPQTFHVFDNIQHPLIIGIDFLTKYKCKIDFETLQFESSINCISINVATAIPLGLARVKKTIVLKPYSQSLVPIRLSKMSHNEVAILEEVPSLRDKNVALGRTIVRSEQGEACCLLMNPLPFEVCIKLNTVVGKLSPIHEHSIKALDKEDKTGSSKLQGKCPNVNSISEVKVAEILDDLGITIDSPLLTADQKAKLQYFIANNRDMFAKDTSELGCTNLHFHSIDTGDAPPQRQPPYRASPTAKKEIEAQVSDMLANDIIEPSDSMWAAPVILCKKRDNTYRFAIDFRRLNAVTKPINFPLPKFDDVVDSVAEQNSKIFTVLDLKSGFHQIPLDPQTRHKTAFVTHDGNYQFKRLPYGLRNAPICFQNVMTQVLRGINFKFALVYVDDIMVHSANFDEHLNHLSTIFQRLREANLKLQPKKCKFATDRVEYLGHFFTSQGIEVNPSKIESVKSFPQPKTQKNVREFLGLCNYYRKFIAKFAEIAAPLNNLLKQDTEFVWSEQCESSFNTLKEKNSPLHQS